MAYRHRAVAAAMLSLTTLAPNQRRGRGGLSSVKAVAPITDVPLFLVNDNRLHSPTSSPDQILVLPTRRPSRAGLCIHAF